jgi:purine-binding chemotaxis protein CheW
MRGVMNLRGEITHIIDLHTLLGLDDRQESLPAKIIVLTPETAGGESIGIIVEEVMGVGNIGNEEIRSLRESAYSGNEGIVKGIIRQGAGTDDDAKGERHLLIWLDLQSLIQDLIRQAGR